MITAKDRPSVSEVRTLYEELFQDKLYIVEIGIGTKGIANRLDSMSIEDIKKIIAWLDTKKWFKPRYLTINYNKGGVVLDRKTISYIKYTEK